MIPAPYFKKYGKLPGVLAFVDGIAAAAIGSITGSVIVIAKRSIIDIPTSLIAVAAMVLLWKFKKVAGARRRGSGCGPGFDHLSFVAPLKYVRYTSFWHLDAFAVLSAIATVFNSRTFLDLDWIEVFRSEARQQPVVRV